MEIISWFLSVARQLRVVTCNLNKLFYDIGLGSTYEKTFMIYNKSSSNLSLDSTSKWINRKHNNVFFEQSCEYYTQFNYL